MVFTGASPTWFLGFDAVLETVFVIITFLIAWYARRAYKYGVGDHLKRWSAGFLLLSAAYLVKAFANLLVYMQLMENRGEPLVKAFMEVTRVYNACFLVHVTILLAGYLLLLSVVLRHEDKRLLVPMGLLILTSAIGSLVFPWLFELVVAVILIQLFVTMECAVPQKRRTSRTFVLGGLLLLFIGQVAYMLLDFHYAYVIGHCFELAGFALLAASMIIIMRKRTSAKQA